MRPDAPRPPAADVNLLDLAAEPDGRSAPHALGRRLPAMVARLLRAAGLAARHQSAVVTVGPSGATAWAVPAGLLDDGDAVEMSRRLGPARLLVHGELGPSRRQGMSLTLRVLRREDGGLAEEVARDFYEEELGPVVHDVARTVATLAGGAGVLEAVQPSAVLGTADPRALLRLQEGLDGVAALEGGIEGADAVRTAESLIAAVEADRSCGEAVRRALGLLASWLDGTQALALARRLHLAVPEESAPRLLLARLHERGGRLEEALRLLGEAPDPSVPPVSAELGRLLLAAGRPEDAATLCARAVDRGPRSATLEDLLGIALGRLGRLEEAEAAFRRAVELEPGAARSWANLARALHQLGERKASAAAYERSLELEGASWQVVRNYAELAVSTGDLDRGEELLRSWRRLRPDDRDADLAVAELLGARGESDRALEVLGEALAHAPGDPRLLATRGAMLLATGETDEAETSYRAALAAAPDDPAMLSNVALLAERRGALGEAEALAERATKLAPGDPIAWQVLERVRRKV